MGTGAIDSMCCFGSMAVDAGGHSRGPGIGMEQLAASRTDGMATPCSLCNGAMLIIDGTHRLRRTSCPNPLNG